MTVRNLPEKQKFYNWYTANREDLDQRLGASQRIASLYKKQNRTQLTPHGLTRWVQEIRRGEWDEWINDPQAIVESFAANARTAAVAFGATTMTDEPDFTDPLSDPIDWPASWAEVNEPFTVTGVSNMGICSDLHLPYHDRYAVQACFAEFKRKEVNGIYLNGDVMDFEKVSHYAQTPDGRYLKDEIEVGRAFLRSLRKMFPTIPIFWKDGNHEHRFTRYIADRCPELANAYGMDTRTQLGLDDLGIQYIPEQQVARFGKLWIAHGHELGLKSGTVNIARQVRMRVGVNLIHGHWHRNQTDSSRNLADEVHAVWSLGCLAYLKPRYTGVLNQWTQGGATVRLHEDAQAFTVTPFQIQDGVVI